MKAFPIWDLSTLLMPKTAPLKKKNNKQRNYDVILFFCIFYKLKYFCMHLNGMNNICMYIYSETQMTALEISKKKKTQTQCFSV